MKLFKQLFIVGLSFYLIIAAILILFIHNAIIYFKGSSLKIKETKPKETIELVIEPKLDDEVKDTPMVIKPKLEKKDTQVKQKEVEPVKDSNTVNPIQDSLKL